MPTSDFDPRYLELWRDAGSRPIKVPVSSREYAFHLRQRLYRCRQAMQKEKHPWAALAAAASIAIKEVDAKGNEKTIWRGGTFGPDGPYTYHLLMSPPDQKFNEALEAAGYTQTEAPSLD